MTALINKIQITVLFLLIALLYQKLSRFFAQRLEKEKAGLEKLKEESGRLSQEAKRLKAENAELEEAAEKTIALYDTAKEICKSLETEKVFALFKENLSRYIKISDCLFIPSANELLKFKYKDYAIVPLKVRRETVGYLAALGVKERDRDKFHILAQQLLLGIKRAHLYGELQELTITDGLTQVFTRRYFLERMHEELARSVKFKHNFSFLMVDIDHFKNFNDRYGHLVGDAILREVSKVIKDNVRQVDFIGRYGGEELSVILTETGREEARHAAERIRQGIEERHVKVYDEDLRVTVSIGISVFPADAKEPSAIIERADEALYLAKQTGRNRICVWQRK